MSRVPKCPNHGEPLEGYKLPIPDSGTGICPVSGVSFGFEASGGAVERTMSGELVPVKGWKTNGND